MENLLPSPKELRWPLKFILIFGSSSDTNFFLLNYNQTIFYKSKWYYLIHVAKSTKWDKLGGGYCSLEKISVQNAIP